MVSLSWNFWRRGPRRPELEALVVLVLVPLVLLRATANAAVDRYLLPVVPLLVLLAGAGWAQMADGWAARASRPALAGFVRVGVVAGQLALLVPYLPDGLTFYSPLLGGAAAAAHVFTIGQGEGLDDAASYLDAEPGAASRVAAVPGFASAFAPYFRGRTIDVTLTSPRDWLAADRVVFYVRQMQTGWPDPLVVAYVASQQRPLYTVRRHGLDYARVFAGPIVVPPELRGASPVSGNSNRSSDAPRTAASTSAGTSSASSARATSARVAAVEGCRARRADSSLVGQRAHLECPDAPGLVRDLRLVHSDQRPQDGALRRLSDHDHVVEVWEATCPRLSPVTSARALCLWAGHPRCGP